MAKYSPFPRREYRGQFRLWVARHRKLLFATGSGVVALLIVETALLLAEPLGPFRWWLLGVLQCVVVAVPLHIVSVAFLVQEQAAIRQLRGAWGEEATRDELERAQRKGLIWGWVDSINLEIGDLDHLVVAREGGLVAIDSKWRSDGTDVHEMARSASRARTRAEGIAIGLHKREKGSHRARQLPPMVKPLVVIWGPAQHRVTEGYELDGIPFVAGRNLVCWLAQISGDAVDEATAADVLRQLQNFRAGAWASNRSRQSSPPPVPHSCRRRIQKEAKEMTKTPG
ncbi:MAG: hypothetical protein QM572_16920 [Nocardioides sp.]|uniref:hypothetical protein n=1 Tax=Nocardioides sp. TaxID=35761 RepID=UPI0039E600BC